MLVDVHAHLDSKEFDNDIQEVIERAKAGGVTAVINCGLDPTSNRKTLELAKRFNLIKPALGFYPSYAIEAEGNIIDGELKFIKNEKPFAVSEVGLDFKYDNAAKQKEVFGKFIKLAMQLDIPLIVHSRKAEEETFEMLKSFGAKKVVMHCFTGKIKTAKKIAEEGWLFSIPPIISHSSQFQELVKSLPLQSLLTETDSPYLSHLQGKRNEPLNVKIAVDKIAELRNLDKMEAEKIIFMNFQRIFLKN